ncbi:hypothetical protein [Kitasatospora purpeofusca]|uniref:hypothetical protein n=1 Tax=Kitasatospora purpeofusca TaxID=67352 RepID=UPI0036C6185F
MTRTTLSAPTVVAAGRVWPHWAAVADFTAPGGQLLRGRLGFHLELPPYATSVALLLGRDNAGSRFTKVLSWPFARHLLHQPMAWWPVADSERAQPGWPAPDGLLCVTDLTAVWPAFAHLAGHPCTQAFGGAAQLWQQARRSALSSEIARQDGPGGSWTIRVAERVAPWLTAHWSVPYPARNAPASRTLAAVTLTRTGSALRGRRDAVLELDELPAAAAALAQVMVGAARTPSPDAAAGAASLRDLLWRYAEGQVVAEGDLTSAHRPASRWLAAVTAPTGSLSPIYKESR